MAEEDNDLEAQAILPESHSTLANNQGMYDRLLRDLINASNINDSANLSFDTIRPFGQHMPLHRRHAWYTETPTAYRWVDEEFQRIVGHIDGGRRLLNDIHHRQRLEAVRVQAVETVQRRIEEELADQIRRDIDIEIINDLIRGHTTTNEALFSPSIGLNQYEIERIARLSRHSIDTFVMEPRTRTYEHFTLTSTCSYPKNINSVSYTPRLPLDTYARREEPFVSMDDAFDTLAELYSST